MTALAAVLASELRADGGLNPIRITSDHIYFQIGLRFAVSIRSEKKKHFQPDRSGIYGADIRDTKSSDIYCSISADIENTVMRLVHKTFSLHSKNFILSWPLWVRCKTCSRLSYRNRFHKMFTLRESVYSAIENSVWIQKHLWILETRASRLV